MNCGMTDSSPEISSSGLELYFASWRSQSSISIYVSTRPTTSDPWGEPADPGSGISSSSLDYKPCLSPDGRALFFRSERPRSTETNLWFARRTTLDGSWDEPVNLSFGDGVGALDCMPGSISADGRTLYVGATLAGGAGGSDLWRVPITPIADFNGDGMVDVLDIDVLKDCWGTEDVLCDIGPMPWGDGIVDVEDQIVLAEYLPGLRSPRARAADVPRDVTLSWIGSSLAGTYDVYLGTSFDDVSNAARGNPLGVFVSQGQNDSSYDPEGLLEYGRTYYWRIDEVHTPPDSTIFKGPVWSFTTELSAYPITEVAVTTNATSKAGEGPENTINGSGINANDEHSTASQDMWLGAAVGSDPVHIQYEFDRVYPLHEMWVWNYNGLFDKVLGFGLKDVTVEYSQDGVSWTSLGDFEFARAPSQSGYGHNTVVGFGGAKAQYVRLTVLGNWGGMSPQYGLSEVRFFYDSTAEAVETTED